MSDEQSREDELVSACLDGEATAVEVAEVEASDALLARLEELRTVRDAVAEPVAPLAAEQRDDLIGAALGVADAGDAARLEAGVVPLQRPRRLLLAMAAAVVVLAAVAGTGLIAGRGGDEADTVARTAAPAADEEPLPEMDMATGDEAMTDAPRAEEAATEEAPAEEAAAAAAASTDAMAEIAEAMADELTRPATEEAAAAQEAPATSATVAAAATATASAEADGGDDSPTAQVVDLGTLESLESLFDGLGASWSDAPEDGAMAEPGACAAAVQERALELSAETVRSFVATVGNADPATFDARLGRRDDGTAVIVYAAPPGCEIGVHELPDP